MSETQNKGYLKLIKREDSNVFLSQYKKKLQCYK